MMNKIKTAFFGTDEISVYVLEELSKANININLIVSTPDTKQGRGMQLTSTPTKVWAEENNIPVVQPEKLNSDFIKEIKEIGGEDGWDLFIVTSYGKIVPKSVLDIPKYQTLNVHPSLLPLYRGPSPIESAMVNDDLDTGVTIMRIDEGVDTGPIVNQEFVSFEEWVPKPIIAEELARVGGKLLAETIELWVNGGIKEQKQNHGVATHTKKISKEDGRLNIKNGNSRKNFLKIMAYTPWPGTFFFKDDKRIKITDAKYNKENDELEILKVIPEGKKETEYKNFISS